MIENIAIILLAFLGQINIVSDINNSSKLLTQFVQIESINEIFDDQKNNWDYYNVNLSLENKLSSLPYKIKNNEININSKSAIVFDVDTDFVLYSKDFEKKMSIASLTKIMTALVVLENKQLDDVVVISQNSFKTEGRKSGLAVGEKIEVENLLKIMMIESNNIAATALAEYTSGSVDEFVKLMNKKAVSLGLKNTTFYNPTGLDQENNNVSTAYEIAQLVDYSLDYPVIWKYSKNQNLTVSSVDGKLKHKIKNTDLLLGKLKNVVGGKTGFTNKAGECLVLIVEDSSKKHKIISVVLNADNRFLETEKLIKWTFGSYRW